MALKKVNYVAEETAITAKNMNDIQDAIIEMEKAFNQPLKFVDSVEEMTDTSHHYVFTSTGTVWVHKTVTKIKTVTDEIVATADNPYTESARLSNGVPQVSGSYSDYFCTPYIDLSKYQAPFTLNLEGAIFYPDAIESYIRWAVYGADKTYISEHRAGGNNPITDAWNIDASDVSVSEDNLTTAITFNKSPALLSGQAFSYVMISAKGTAANAHLSINYEKEVEEAGWVDTGVACGGSMDDTTLQKIATLNNEGADPITVKLLPAPVLEFYNKEAYPDNDYTVTHLGKITYPCRADIPVPFTVKWQYNENAMRTTVAVDTKPIGTSNIYSMFTYDVTGRKKFSLYNLLPSTTYYYKVTHILADGSIIEAKNGSFTTSTETWRLIYIDGTQNVRDLGGWTGLNGKKTKYGKIFRGATLSDSSFPELMLTGKGKRTLGELKVQAELNLGAVDTETSIAANCSYKKIGYYNYATSFTDTTAKTNFKAAIEYIVESLTAGKNIYMHCQGGCDRTGTLSFQILGLLGVSESDLAKEYELSSFSMIGYGRRRTTQKAVDTYDYVGMVEALKTYSGDTITDKFYNFATTGCGISAETIDNLRSLMLA